MLRVSGYWLMVTSLIHVGVGVWLFAEPLMDIARDGWFNAVAPNPFAPYFDREDAFWFMMIVPLLFALGQLCCWAQDRQIILPSSLGWILLTTAIVGIFFEPISGFWLLLPPSLLIILAARYV